GPGELLRRGGGEYGGPPPSSLLVLVSEPSVDSLTRAVGPRSERRRHAYELAVEWTGNLGTGTSAYTAYSRNHRIVAPARPPLLCSSDPSFRGDPSRYSPEELLVASLSSCHMLWYLHLCAEA